MKELRFSAVLLWACVLSLAFTNVAAAQEVKLEGVPFQQILDRLFGTTANPGLLDSNKRFELRAEDVVLTRDQALSFFVPTSANTSDIADFITAAEQLRGVNVKVEGLMDGAPFEFKLDGKEVKLEGLDLTRAQLDSLIEQLKGITGLREAKIESLVDGRPIEVKIENRAGRVKIEDRERHNADVRLRERERDDDRERVSSREVSNRDRGEREVERLERIEKVERERQEKIERMERPDRRGPGKP
jgi:hypothetical protein